MLKVTVSYSDNDNVEDYISDLRKHKHHRLMEVIKPKKEKGTHKKLYVYLANK